MMAATSFLLVLFTLATSTALNLTSTVVCNPDLNKCYQFGFNALTFWESERTCIELGGHLASIHSKVENDYVMSIGKLANPSSSYYWIGATLGIYGFQWNDGTPLNYTNWSANQPSQDCALQSATSGIWISSPSTNRYPFICSVPAATPSNCPTTPIPTTGTPIRSTTFQSTTGRPSTSPKQCFSSCESGWTYLAATDSCYKVFHNAKWSEAEVQCVSYDAHLTSIHSDTENTFVNNLASSGNKRVNVTSLAWIGMQKINGHWAWTDDTYSDYFQWAPKQPDNLQTELCVQTAADITDNGWYQEWNNLNCNFEIRAYICKKASYHQ